MIIYELLVGEPPFNDDSTDKIFDNILNSRISWPKISNDKLLSDDTSLSQDSFDLIKDLLTNDPEKRLGCNSINQIKKAPFFKSN